MIGPLTPPEPRHTRAIACRDAAFRMVELRRPLRLCKISGLNSIATLLPCCLRLALPVTRQHPRLANGGSLRFAVRVFHPLNYPPFFWAHSTFNRADGNALNKVFLQESVCHHNRNDTHNGYRHADANRWKVHIGHHAASLGALLHRLHAPLNIH